MLARYRTLRAILDLREFTADELAEAANVKVATVRTVLARESQLVERIGVVSTGRRGGQPIRYRLLANAEEPLRARLDAAARAFSSREVDTDGGSGTPSALLAAEEMLLEAPGTGLTPRTKLASASIGLRSGREAQSRTSGGARAEVAVHVAVTDFLLRLADAEYRLAQGESDVYDFAQFRTSLETLERTVRRYDEGLLSRLEERIDASPIRDRLGIEHPVASPLSPVARQTGRADPVHVVVVPRSRRDFVASVVARYERDAGVMVRAGVVDVVLNRLIAPDSEWDAAYDCGMLDFDRIEQAVLAVLRKAARRDAATSGVIEARRAPVTRRASVTERIKQLMSEIENTDSDFDREKLQERLARLSTDVAVVKVGATTETEMKEKKRRVEDALQAARAALEEGVVPGGGVALLNAADAVRGAVDSLDGDERTGAQIILRALEEPLRQLAINAGLEGSVVVQQVRSSKPGQGLNVDTGEVTDLVKAGITDPAMVTRSALQNAASIAKNILTTEAIVVEAPETRVAAAGAGMPDMGGMM